MEAYSVLSVRDSRINYDLLRKKNPLNYEVQSEAQFQKEFRPDMRDAAGNTPRTKPSTESYAAERMAELAEQRKMYNVNPLGYYSGGLPQPGRGPVRGSSLGNPGEFHLPQVHNALNNFHQDSFLVTSEDAVKFKAYMNSDKYDFKRSRPVHPPYYDSEFLFMKDRSYWGALFFGLMTAIFVKKRWQVESDRWHMWVRKDSLTQMPGHHFVNKGGVVLKKQFVGFEKYHQNNDEMMNWTSKAFPEAFPKSAH